MKLIFQSEHLEEHKISEKNLIRLYPYGITLTQIPGRPILLLKDEAGENTLPVAINQLEAGVAVQQSQNSVAVSSPHHVTKVILESLNIKIEKCVFVEIKSQHQYVRLTIDGHPKYGSLKFKADEVMSLCLHLNIPIYATQKLMKKSQTMSAELEGIAQGIELNPAVMMRTHEYLC
jgi:bifunctional DNase/RNase